MGSKLVTAKAENAPLSADSTKRGADFSKGRPPIHLSYPIASPALAFRCKIPIDKPKQPTYTSPTKKEVLINGEAERQTGYRGREDHLRL